MVLVELLSLVLINIAGCFVIKTLTEDSSHASRVFEFPGTEHQTFSGTVTEIEEISRIDTLNTTTNRSSYAGHNNESRTLNGIGQAPSYVKIKVSNGSSSQWFIVENRSGLRGGIDTGMSLREGKKVTVTYDQTYGASGYEFAYTISETGNSLSIYVVTLLIPSLLVIAFSVIRTLAKRKDDEECSDARRFTKAFSTVMIVASVIFAIGSFSLSVIKTQSGDPSGKDIAQNRMPTIYINSCAKEP